MRIKQRLNNVFVLAVLGILFSVSVFAQTPSRRDEDKSSGVSLAGPGVHLFGGIRMQKSPNIDTFDSAVFGFKFSVLSVFFGNSTYISIAAPGVGYVGQQNRLAFLISPLIFSHVSGVGLSVDLYDVRPDRSGGPLGASLNIDPIRMFTFATAMMNK